MTDTSKIRRALDLAIQARSYARLGAVGADLATGTKQELETEILSWATPEREALSEIAEGILSLHGDLDRGRNHLMKDFSLRFGPDRSTWTSEAREKLTQGIAEFTGRKDRAIEDAAERLARRLQQTEVGA